MIAFRRRGAALVCGLVVGALLVGGTVLLAEARNPPPPETADLSLPLLPVPTLPMPIVPILPAIPAPSAPRRAAKPQRPAPPAARTRARSDVVARTNAERIRAGCGALRVDGRLSPPHGRTAPTWSTGATSSTTARTAAPRPTARPAAGYSDYGGENIAYGQRSAAEVVSDWMGSPDHRRNILDCDFTTIGVGLDPRGMYWTQEFGY